MRKFFNIPLNNFEKLTIQPGFASIYHFECFRFDYYPTSAFGYFVSCKEDFPKKIFLNNKIYNCIIFFGFTFESSQFAISNVDSSERLLKSKFISFSEKSLKFAFIYWSSLDALNFYN